MQGTRSSSRPPGRWHTPSRFIELEDETNDELEMVGGFDDELAGEATG